MAVAELGTSVREFLFSHADPESRWSVFCQIQEFRMLSVGFYLLFRHHLVLGPLLVPVPGLRHRQQALTRSRSQLLGTYGSGQASFGGGRSSKPT